MSLKIHENLVANTKEREAHANRVLDKILAEARPGHTYKSLEAGIRESNAAAKAALAAAAILRLLKERDGKGFAE